MTALEFLSRCLKKATMVREWYDGYRFVKKEVYNPWNILLYTDDVRSDAEAYPKPHWADTSSNSIVRELVERSDTSMKMKLEKLITGGQYRSRSMRISPMMRSTGRRIISGTFCFLRAI